MPGVGALGTVEGNDDEEWLRVLDVNVVGIARVSAAALPSLRRSSTPVIVNTASIPGTHGLPQRALHSASKDAVAALTRAMAADHLREGIRVNCVSSGTADTPWVGRLLDAAGDPAADAVNSKCGSRTDGLVSADEVATSILFRPDPVNGSTSGTVLPVDGGMHDLLLRPAD
ncbi:SDR family oxidoreductase [Kocuria aegyptia]|uniref:SDR family oxidoreductase n=1 Tax=Kocuria aegyptia TaxID=330943 RepID=A0ABP4X2A4_9MICC